MRPSFYQHIVLSLFFHDCAEIRQGPSPFALAACTAAGNRGTGSLALRPSAHRCAISRHSRSSASPRRFDAAAADQGSAGPLDPPQDCLAGPFFYQHPRRPTVDGAAPLVHLHDFYVCGIRAGPPLTGRRTTCISISERTGHYSRSRPLCGEPRTLPRRPRCRNWLAGVPAPPSPRETPHPTAPRTLQILFIGLAGLPAPRTPRDTSIPAPPRTLLFSLSA